MALKRTIQRAAAVIPMPLLRSLARPTLVAPCYHLVHDDEPPHLRHLFAARRPEVFAADLEFFCNHFHPVSLAEVAAAVRDQTPLPSRAALISFDDGLREFKEVAAPILEAKGVPATCFVNSAFIDNRELSFRSKTSLLMSRLQEEPAPAPASLTALAQILNCPGAPRRQLSARLFALPYSKRRKLDQAADVLEVDFDEFLHRHRPYLSTGELRELAGRGFDLGAHGVDHAPFAELGLEEQIEQTRSCCQDLRTSLGVECTALAFPFSDRHVSLEFFDRAHNEAGVELFFGTDYLRDDCIPGSFQRFPFDELARTARELTAWIMVKKAVRRIVGRDRIHRS